MSIVVSAHHSGHRQSKYVAHCFG